MVRMPEISSEKLLRKPQRYLHKKEMKKKPASHLREENHLPPFGSLHRLHLYPLRDFLNIRDSVI